MSPYDGGQRPAFGRIDPFVWFPVFGLLALTVVLILGNAAVWSPVPVVFGVGLVLLDARINRPSAGGGSGRRSR